MRATFWLACTTLLLSACHQEPMQQGTAAYVPPAMRSTMSDEGLANCAMLGGALSIARQLDGSSTGVCALPNGKRCSERALTEGGCGSR
ncbi:DUF333 domain-containing protein [Enterobacteriaceae bacterium ESL0689]|nr:DUF333 domain-containing protein [Enterobacteriaceae bacterium ESL0689]